MARVRYLDKYKSIQNLDFRLGILDLLVAFLFLPLKLAEK